MGWMETLTKEAFFAAVREAVKPDFETLEKRIETLEKTLEKRIETLENRLESEMKGVNGQIKGLEGEIAGIKSQIESLSRDMESLRREINSNNIVLEGKIENIHTSVEAFFNKTKADFYQKLYEKGIEVSKTPLPENTR